MRRTVWYVHWRSWAFGKRSRLNGTMRGYNPYTSYRFGPIELRIYEWGGTK